MVPIHPGAAVQSDLTTGIRRTLSDDETSAYDRLTADPAASRDEATVSVTGPLTETDSGYELQVRQFHS